MVVYFTECNPLYSARVLGGAL